MKRIYAIIDKIDTLDSKAITKAQNRLDSLTKPPGSLGKLEDLAKQISGITATSEPSLEHKAIFTFAADHGVAEEKVSHYPKEVTAQMVYNFLNGGAGINVLAKHAGARVIVADLGVATDILPHDELIVKKIDYGTKNMARGPAMSREQAVEAICAGMEIFELEYKKGIHICGLGEMGIANTTASSAITACFTKKAIEEITGRGTGIDDSGLSKKISAIKKALEINKPDREDPIDVLAKIGGFEIGGLAGVVLAASARRIPVVLDGFISSAAALIAYKLAPQTKLYMIASHISEERGHKIILDHIGLREILDLNFRLGEGTGAALGISMADAAVKILTLMATFKSANVSDKPA